jgi:hypothetical protein
MSKLKRIEDCVNTWNHWLATYYIGFIVCDYVGYVIFLHKDACSLAKSVDIKPPFLYVWLSAKFAQ